LPAPVLHFAIVKDHGRIISRGHIGLAIAMFLRRALSRRGTCGVASAVKWLRPAFVSMWVAKMSAFDVVESFRKSALPFRIQVSISRDDEDFVITFLPQNIVAMRHSEANELRKMCRSLRWEIVSDTVPEPGDIRSW
jgi:hypothetical protein